VPPAPLVRDNREEKVMICAENDISTGKIGWLCGYVPEELILAAGLQPVRIQGEVDEVREANAYMFPNPCPYLQNILDSGLRGHCRDLQGIIFTSSCDCMRRLYDLWRHHVKTPFSYMLEVPKSRSENAVLFFSQQISELKTRLEEFFGVTISESKIGEAISLMNEHRSLIMRLFEGQKRVPPPHRGSKLLGLCLDSMTGSKERTMERLREALEYSVSGNASSVGPPRVLVAGNVVDRLDLFEMVEAAGASVVVFDTCAGLRHWSSLVEDGRDLIESLVRRYLLKPPCPRIPGYDERVAHVAKLTQEYSVDAVIYSVLKFCDYGLFEAPVIEAGLHNPKVPFLVLENDYVWSDTGRMKTRIAAFVEMIKHEFS
jgi:benzoyl-CoA reductase subunit C